MEREKGENKNDKMHVGQKKAGVKTTRERKRKEQNNVHILEKRKDKYGRDLEKERERLIQ